MRRRKKLKADIRCAWHLKMHGFIIMATGREQKGAYSRNSGIVKETISIANSFQHCVLSSTVEGFAISILYRLGPVFGSGLKHSPNIARLSTSVVFWRAIHLDTNQNFAFRATRLAPKLGYFLAGTPMYCLDGLVDRLQSTCGRYTETHR
jgi:hypothetical protein